MVVCWHLEIGNMELGTWKLEIGNMERGTVELRSPVRSPMQETCRAEVARRSQEADPSAPVVVVAVGNMALGTGNWKLEIWQLVR